MMELHLDQTFSLQYYIVFGLFMFTVLLAIWVTWQFAKKILRWLAD